MNGSAAKKLSNILSNPRIIIFKIGIRGHFRFIPDTAYLKLMYWSVFGRKLEAGKAESESNEGKE